MEQNDKSSKKIKVIAIIFLVIWVLLNVSFFLLALVWGFGKVQAFSHRHFILYLDLLPRISSSILVFLNMPLILSILLFCYSKEKTRDWWLFSIASVLTLFALLGLANLFDIYKIRHLVFQNGSSSAKIIVSLGVSGIIFVGNVVGVFGIFNKRKWVRTFLIIFFILCLLYSIYALLNILKISGISSKYLLISAGYIFFYIFALYYFVKNRGQVHRNPESS